jgi:PHD/YefM family antitoxin component YafN of YafNO toxin-antitoxin module
MEYQIGTTDLRQKLTDVIQQIKEKKTTYVVETFGRPQVAMIDLAQYRQFQQFQQERQAFFNWMEETAVANAEHNANLNDEEILAIIEQAREDVATEQA